MSQSYTTHAKLEISFDNGEGSNRNSMNCVDKTVPFPIESQILNKNVEMTSVQLGSNYNSVKSLTDNKSDMAARTNVQNVVMSSNVGGIGMTNAKFISNFSMLQQPVCVLFILLTLQLFYFLISSSKEILIFIVLFFTVTTLR